MRSISKSQSKDRPSPSRRKGSQGILVSVEPIMRVVGSDRLSRRWFGSVTQERCQLRLVSHTLAARPASVWSHFRVKSGSGKRKWSWKWSWNVQIFIFWVQGYVKTNFREPKQTSSNGIKFQLEATFLHFWCSCRKMQRHYGISFGRNNTYLLSPNIKTWDFLQTWFWVPLILIANSFANCVEASLVDEDSSPWKIYWSFNKLSTGLEYDYVPHSTKKISPPHMWGCPCPWTWLPAWTDRQSYTKVLSSMNGNWIFDPIPINTRRSLEKKAWIA